MDEIDAASTRPKLQPPLRILEELQEHSQLIFITHNAKPCAPPGVSASP